jgi:uncharacterized membrane protein YphA (DoxX/SURF4 family)
MRMNHTTTTQHMGKPLHIALWLGQIVLAAAFISAGGLKLAGAEQMVTLFDKIGVGQWLRYVTGTVEVTGAICLLVPRLVDKAATLLALTMMGAFLTHVLWIGGNPAPAALLAFGSAAIAYLRSQSPTVVALLRRVLG